MSAVATIHRHRTAMVRHGFSQPVSMLVRHGLVGPGTHVLDYGCGQGDDVRALAAQDVRAKGWDPHFAPDGDRVRSTVVNLGFVLNVIEDPEERREALAGAWSLTEKVLAVAVMVHGQASIDALRPFGDGYVTSRQTFQKYYLQGEVRQYIASVTETEAVSIAPGIFFVFRRSEDEQDFLLDRRRSNRGPMLSFDGRTGPSERRTKPAPLKAEPIVDRIPSTMVELAGFVSKRGRLPFLDELSAIAIEEIERSRVSLSRASDAFTIANPGLLEQVGGMRRDDLLVHQALAILNRRNSTQAMSLAMVRDVRVLFGSQQKLAMEAMQYLYALSDAPRIEALCIEASGGGTGVCDDRGRLVIHAARVGELAGPLRCYIGCGTHLAGEPEGAHLIRLDPKRKRIKFLLLANERLTLPEIKSSIVVDLRRQDVFIGPEALRLVGKSRLFASTSKRQKALEAKHARETGHPPNSLFQTIE